MYDQTKVIEVQHGGEIRMEVHFFGDIPVWVKPLLPHQHNPKFRVGDAQEMKIMTALQNSYQFLYIGLGGRKVSFRRDGKDRRYWYAWKRTGGKLRKMYVCCPWELSVGLIRQVAEKMIEVGEGLASR